MAYGKKKQLTPKQLHFCRCVASGLTLSDAYREAYDTKGSQATVNNAGSQLYKQPEIRQRIDQLIAAREQAVIRAAVTDRERVVSFLREMMLQAAPTDAQKIRAAELLGKTAGLFNNDTRGTDNKDNIQDLQHELHKKLQQALLQVEQDKAKVLDVTDYEQVPNGND